MTILTLHGIVTKAALHQELSDAELDLLVTQVFLGPVQKRYGDWTNHPDIRGLGPHNRHPNRTGEPENLETTRPTTAEYGTAIYELSAEGDGIGSTVTANIAASKPKSQPVVHWRNNIVLASAVAILWEEFSTPGKLTGKNKWQVALETISGKNLAPELQHSELEKYLRNCTVNFQYEEFRRTSAMVEIWWMVREILQGADFDRSADSPKKTPNFYLAGVAPLASHECLDLDAIVKNIGTRRAGGKLRPASITAWDDANPINVFLTLPTPLQIKELLLEVCRKRSCALTLQQAQHLVTHVFELHGVESSSLPATQVPSTPPPPQEIKWSAGQIIKAIHAVDQCPIEKRHPNPKKERRRLGKLLTEFALWMKYPVTGPQAGATGLYTLDVYAKVTGIPLANIHDWMKKRLLPLLQNAQKESGLRSNDFAKVLKLLQEKFYHLKPEFVDDSRFINNEGIEGDANSDVDG
jgi:hypothetical protein